MRPLTTIIAAFALLVDLGGRASADDFDVCYRDSGDVAIAACTRAINSRQYKGVKLAQLYVNRGAEWDNKGEFDKELADLSEAIKHDVSQAAIYKNRATVYRKRGELERAITDYTTAVGLDPKYTAAFTSRGLAYEEKKDFANAKADYRAALAVPPKYNDGQWAHTIAGAHLEALTEK
jgi:tetratricopeptide (TPR) repeat protein